MQVCEMKKREAVQFVMSDQDAEGDRIDCRYDANRDSRRDSGSHGEFDGEVVRVCLLYVVCSIAAETGCGIFAGWKWDIE